MAEASAYEETLKLVESCLSRIRWRLRPQGKRRLLNDILFLCTRLRAVVLVDYDGTMPKLQENLCALLHCAQQESVILKPLRVMVIKDMAYLIHVKEVAELASSSLTSQDQLIFVDMEKNPCKLLSGIEENQIASELASIQNLFSAAFPVEVNVDLLPITQNQAVKKQLATSEYRPVDMTIINELSTNKGNEVVDLSDFLQDARIALPSLNGWLLGYPITYVFGEEHAEKAMWNLSTLSLYVYKIFVCRNQTSGSRQCEDELMSFTVPCGISTRLDEEPWAEAFLARMRAKIERCKHVWASIRLEVSQSHSHAVVL